MFPRVLRFFGTPADRAGGSVAGKPRVEKPILTREPALDTSPKVSDEIRRTTCYMCACRCGIDVHLTGGRVSYIEGNRDHPVNRGVLCAKGSAGIMQHVSPARLRAPLRRTGPRGSGEFSEITWDEALDLAASWLRPIRETAPEKLAFFTGRDQSQSFTGWWAQQYGTPNYAAHGGFCSVNMAAAGIYTMGGAFWEFGAPDWERTKLFMIFGVAEDHDSNPIKMGLGRLKARGAKVIGVNPVRTGYNAIADEWLAITPGTDGLFILSLVHVLMGAGKVDLDYLMRYTNAAHLVDQDPRSADYGLFLRDRDGAELVWDREKRRAVPWNTPGVKPAMSGTVNIGPTHAKPVFQLMADAYLDPKHAPEAVAEATGIPAATIRRIAAELAHVAFEQEITLDRPWTDFRGERHETMTGRPVSFHAMRGISAHSNGFQTCRALHLLQIILGSVETPGGFRFKPPYPKPVDAHPRPHHKVTPGYPLDGPHLGYPRGPEDLALDADGPPQTHRQGLHLGGAALGPRPDAHGDLQRRRRRSLPDRHAVPLHGQHGLELVDEHRPGHGHADRHRRDRRVRHPAHHLFRRLFFRDRRLRRPDPARHHLSRTPRLHQPARPPDLANRTRWPTRSAGRWWSPSAPATKACAVSSRSCSTSASASACPAWSTTRGKRSIPTMPTT